MSILALFLSRVASIDTPRLLFGSDLADGRILTSGMWLSVNTITTTTFECLLSMILVLGEQGAKEVEKYG